MPAIPVWALITFEVIVVAMINKLRESPETKHQQVKLQLGEAVISGGRESYLHARLEQTPAGL